MNKLSILGIVFVQLIQNVPCQAQESCDSKMSECNKACEKAAANPKAAAQDPSSMGLSKCWAGCTTANQTCWRNLINKVAGG